MMKNRNSSWIKFAMYAVVAVLLNIAVQTVFFRLDLTSDNRYSLSETSRSMVAGLEEPLTVKVFLSSNLPYPYNNLEQEVRDILEEYSVHANRNFNYQINVISDSDETDEAERAGMEQDARGFGVSPVQIQKVEKDEIKLVSAYMGMAVIHADMVKTVPVLNPDENMEYVVTSTIMSMQEKTATLLSLKENVKVDLFLSSSLFPISRELQTYPESLADTVESLNKTNYGRISFTWHNPDSEPAAEAEAAGLDVKPFSLQNRDGSESSVYASVAVSHEGRISVFDVLSRGLFGYVIKSPADIEPELNGVIENIIGIGKKVAWLSDHSAVPLYGGGQSQPSASAFAGLSMENYDLTPLMLSSGVIPDDTGSLMIVRPEPSAPFTEWELYQIDQFVMKGGSLAVFMDGFMEFMPQSNGYQQPQPAYIPRNTGLEKLLAHYGVEIGNSYVLDENCYRQQQRTQTGIMDIPVYFAPLIKPENINTELPVMEGLKGLVMLNCSPLKIAEDLPEDRNVDVLFSSSGNSWLISDPSGINLYNPMMYTPPAPGERNSYPLAAVISGSLDSYFAGKTVPEPDTPDNKGELSEETALALDKLSRSSNMKSHTDSGKVYVFGSHMAISDSVIDPEGKGPNSVMLQNILDDMNGRTDFAEMRAKGLAYNPLRETSPAARTFIKTLNMIIVPALAAAAGLAAWTIWRRRKKKIAQIFMEDGQE